VDSSSTSSSRRFPRALALASVLVLAGEVAITAALPVNQGRTQVDDLLAELETPQTNRDTVLWADSVTAGPVRDAGGSPQIADLSSTQSVSMAGVYFTYRRFVETAGPPKLLVLSLVPESYANDLHQAYTTTYFESAFLRWDEIRGYAEVTGRYAQALRMAGYKFLRPPSMMRRAAVRRYFQRLRVLRGDPLAKVPRLRVVGSDPGVVKGLSERARLIHFEASSITRVYLESLAQETASTGTRMVVVTPALPKTVAEGWSGTGYMREYEAILDELAKQHPHVTIDPVLQFADFEDRGMYDGCHLKPVPGRTYGERFLKRVVTLAGEWGR